MSKPVVLSGIQPTGQVHLGNYLGAIKPWTELQHSHTCFFMLADMHAITVPQEPARLRENVRVLAATLLACGIDPEICTIFPQSAVSAHAELGWILGCHTPLGWLNRMTQFKDKAGNQKDKASLGLYSYPVLQAADILLYRATHVPVGEDQKQHLELSRDIAGAFNRAVDEDFFQFPEPLIMPEVARIMSLRDGLKKMSKSDSSEYSRINLTDDNDTIALKIRKAKSDMVDGLTYEPESRPEAANLLRLYAALQGKTVQNIVSEIENYNFSTLKERLVEQLIIVIEPIRNKINQMVKSTDSLDEMLKNHAERAKAVAEETMKAVRMKTGFWQA